MWLMSQNRRMKYRKNKKKYLVKKIDMKSTNKYVFRTIISEFLYFQKKKFMVVRSKRLSLAKSRRGSGMAARPKTLGSDMITHSRYFGMAKSLVKI